MARPMVLNLKIVNLLNNPPSDGLKPNTFSLVQRKALECGCFPFPFMVNDDNVPLDGRTVIVNGEPVRLETRPVVPICVRNAYSSSYDNGRIEWSNGVGYIRSNVPGNNTNIPRFAYDAQLGVTYGAFSLHNPVFVGMDNTAPIEWRQVRDILNETGGVGVCFGLGTTLEIANNVLFRAWSGYTFDLVEQEGGQSGEPGVTFAFFQMRDYSFGGGTYSPFFDRYEYRCLDQIFNSDKFATVGLSPDDFWEGRGISFGSSGEFKGESLLYQAVTGGDNAGSLFLFSNPQDFNYAMLVDGVSAGQTLSGRQLAINLYSLSNFPPYIDSKDPRGGFIETMALLLGTEQKIITLLDGTTASIRGRDIKSPCAPSWIYNEATELGKWGYEVLKMPIGSDVFVPSTPPDVGCNIPSFVDYVTGVTGKSHGIVHPLSWMLWKGISSGGQITEYKLGYLHVYNEETDVNGDAIYDKIEGIHDHLCYEFEDNDGIVSRVYYPLRPITSQWYNANVSPQYSELITGNDLAKSYGITLNQKYDTGFQFSFRTNAGSILTPISLRYLEGDGIITINYDGMATNLNGVTGIMFPYLIPIATFAMDGIGEDGKGSVTISGEFDHFSDWSKEKFGVGGDLPPRLLYQYYADGVTSAAPDSAAFPYDVTVGTKPNFRLFSWNALSKIRARNRLSPNTPQEEVQSSFTTSQTNDLYGVAEYSSPNTLKLDGSIVDVDPENYPPRVLPQSATRGLTYARNENGDLINSPLDCGSYVNLIRYANITPPNESLVPGAFGVTATKELIARTTLGATEKDLLAFDPDKIPDGGELHFTRDGFVPNTSDTFFDSGNNFFFSTGMPTLSVFDAPYYLTAQEYFNKYVNNNTISTWWENIDLFNLAVDTDFDPTGNAGFAFDITKRLISPADGDVWSANPQLGFRPTVYDSFLDTINGEGLFIGGVIQALNDGLHPGLVYRLFTTKVIQDLGETIERECIDSWRSGGVPCHEIPEVMQALKTNGGIYNSYFSGSTGCDSVGNEFTTAQFNQQKGKDFFGRCAIGVVPAPGTGLRYAYGDYYYAPLPTIPGNTYFAYQNQNCLGGGQINDPPSGATLSEFGRRFAEALNIAGRTGNVNIDDPKALRDQLFAFSGNTASLDGVGNNVGNTFVSDWLQQKMSTIFDYFNAERTRGGSDLAVVDSVLTEIYPSSFPAYKNSFNAAGTYRLWAIKPACVEKWTPECSNLATQLTSSTTYRMTAFAPSSQVFAHKEFNAGVAPEQISSRRTIQDYNALAQSNPSNQSSQTISPTRMSDVVAENEGFLSSFRTIYIEPLGVASNVLATEAQAVPRATISSTVFGKLTTIIDQNGFLKDVNQITFESGFGTKILGDNTTGNLKFSVTGLTLGSLEDVSITGISGGDILVYDAELGRWINKPFSDVVAPFLFGLTAEPNFFYQSTPPDEGITMGSRWMDSSTGIEYIYIIDGDSEQWIQASN